MSIFTFMDCFGKMVSAAVFFRLGNLKVLILFKGFFLCSTITFGQVPEGYSYAKQITLLSSQVSGTSHTDFPVLISLTDADLRTTTNGGHVTNASGYDIIFTTNDCLTKLDHQIESYSETTGTYIAWVRIPILSNSANTIIHMYYGNSSVSTNTSVNTTWDSNYRAVWHFNNSLADNTSNGNNLTNFSTTNLTGAKVADGRDLNNNTNVLSNAAGQYLQLANGFFSGITNFTFEGWVFLDRSDTNWERIFDFGQSVAVNFFLCPSPGIVSPAETRARITTNTAANEQGPVSANVTNTGSWVHWSVVLDNATSTMTLYKNGAVLATASGTVTNRPQNIEPSTANYFGRSQYAADHYIDAKFDEFRISTAARSAGWIATAYNNQNSPSTFYTISTEVAAATLCGPLPIELESFEGASEKGNVLLHWTTASELNNEKFIVERSANGFQWSPLDTLPGAGTSTVKHSYEYADRNVSSGQYYYRLIQIDYDGTKTYSHVVAVYVDHAYRPTIYTNSGGEIVVVPNVEGNVFVSVINLVGQRVLFSIETINDRVILNTSTLTPGVYVVIVNTVNGTFSQKVIKQ